MDLHKIILEKIDVRNPKLSDSYYYQHLPLCIIDSVFSIGVKYTSVLKVIDNFCKYCHIENKYRDRNIDPKNVENNFTIDDFQTKFKKFEPQELALKVFKNSQRTSTKNGILKAQAVQDFFEIFAKYNINNFCDLSKLNTNIEKEILMIKGQKSGISLMYFYMLSGSEYNIKPDRMVLRFLSNALQIKVTTTQAIELINQCCNDLLTHNNIKITPRELDHLIWNYQRSVPKVKKG